jgi:hypothetical protein
VTNFISRSRDIASRKLDGEMNIVSIGNSTLFTLNEAATMIWEAADGQTPISKIVERIICEEYEVDYQTAMRDTMALIQKLAADGLLRISEFPCTGQTGESA